MVTRRQTTIGLVSVALGSAAVSSASFVSDTTASADLRVVMNSELTLTPARPDEEYVNTDENDEVESIEIQYLNQRASTWFEGLIRVTNNGDVGYDSLAFEFVPTESDPNGENEAAAETLEITSESDTGTDQQGRTTLLDDANEELAPGDTVTFGVMVNLIASSSPGDLDDLPDGSNVALEITAKRE